MTCGCFPNALRISEQLHRVQSSLAVTPFDQALSGARQASQACAAYAVCRRCGDPAHITLYVMILRQATSCYAALLHSSSSSDSSPGSASSSGSSGASARYAAATRLRVGSFEVTAPLGENVKITILRSEIRRAAEAAAALDGTLSSGSAKGSGRGRDAATLSYYKGLVDALRVEIANVEALALAH